MSALEVFSFTAPVTSPGGVPCLSVYIAPPVDSRNVYSFQMGRASRLFLPFLFATSSASLSALNDLDRARASVVHQQLIAYSQLIAR